MIMLLFPFFITLCDMKLTNNPLPFLYVINPLALKQLPRSLHFLKSLPRFFKIVVCKYLLLTEFEGRTVSYGPSFFPFDLSRAINRRGKSEDP